MEFKMVKTSITSKAPLVLVSQDTAWVHFQGRTFKVSLNKKKTRILGEKNLAGDGLLRSPMPGKILKINKSTGDSVNAGDTVCVLEAMKMEYAVKAPFAGKIKRIEKRVGDQVGLEELLVEIIK
jgi:acetyl-CoA/propionyl-CoA carboxylase biotin carboxyl carrier protein